MTWIKLKFLLMDAALFAARYWYLLVALVVFVLVAGTVDNCRRRSLEGKLDGIGTNIADRQAESRVLTNRRTDIEEEVKRNESNTNAARGAFDDALRTDSNRYGNGADLEDRFCRKFCADSSCYEWRKTHRCDL